MDKCPVYRVSSKKWTHVRPRDLVDSPAPPKTTLACKAEREGEGRLECGGPQLGVQWRSSSDRAWAERSSGGLVPASAGGG